VPGIDQVDVVSYPRGWARQQRRGDQFYSRSQLPENALSLAIFVFNSRYFGRNDACTEGAWSRAASGHRKGAHRNLRDRCRAARQRRSPPPPPRPRDGQRRRGDAGASAAAHATP
jgi:hypothetical protein